jgi:hypothetical protein
VLVRGDHPHHGLEQLEIDSVLLKLQTEQVGQQRLVLRDLGGQERMGAEPRQRVKTTSIEFPYITGSSTSTRSHSRHFIPADLVEEANLQLTHLEIQVT